MPWSVALPLPLSAYDFAAPHGFEGNTPVGCRVIVPWQGSVCVGLVVGEGTGQSHRMREAICLLEPEPFICLATLEALVGMAKSARLPLGLLLSDVLPIGWNPELSHVVACFFGTDLSPFGAGLEKLGTAYKPAEDFDMALLDAVREQGLLLERIQIQTKLESVYIAIKGQGKLTEKQEIAWQTLEREGSLPSLAEWSRRAGVGTSVVSGVLNKGWAKSLERPAPLPRLPEPFLDGLKPSSEPLLEWENSKTQRLHGGSPRTRLAQIAQEIMATLERGQNVLYLCPDQTTLERAWRALSYLGSAGERENARGRESETARGREKDGALEAREDGDLNPQEQDEIHTQDLLTSYPHTFLPSSAALKFTSTLSSEARAHAWNLARAGHIRLAFGTSLALTLPLPNVGLVVLEEEGADGYKMQSGSRLFIPDLLRRICNQQGMQNEVKLLLTGTVPAVESLSVTGRVLPAKPSRVHIVDYAASPVQPELGPLSDARFKQSQQGWPLSTDLKTALKQVADRGRQAVLIAPRKGYSALLRCSSCGHTPMCQNCDVTLRFHAEDRKLECHQCGYHLAPPTTCPDCGEAMLQPKGPGTEWIAREVAKFLPGFPVLRYDREKQDDLFSLERGEPGVVVGTTMLLSQAAPPNLAVIALTFADTLLSLSDFRATERYHTLLRKLLEWHPKAAPLLLIQTYQAENPALVSILEGFDAAHYPALELKSRRLLGYPPFVQLAQVIISTKDPHKAQQQALELTAQMLASGATQSELLGPAPSPIARLKGLYSYHLLLRAKDEARLEVLLGWLERSRGVRMRVDLNPRQFVGL